MGKSMFAQRNYRLIWGSREQGPFHIHTAVVTSTNRDCSSLVENKNMVSRRNVLIHLGTKIVDMIGEFSLLWYSRTSHLQSPGLFLKRSLKRTKVPLGLTMVVQDNAATENQKDRQNDQSSQSELQGSPVP
ncbi:MAG: hypothetical protein ACYSW0_26145 [Planctomycetota bacterium]